VAVVDLSVGRAGQGDAVVLLHAFPLSSAMWLAQREALSSSYRILTPDQRGFGSSPLGDDPPSLDLAADDIAALLDAEDLDGVVLAGLSMGGYVAMAFCRRHPDRLRGLVLADTKASADSAAARANRERIAAAVERDPESSVLADEVLPTLVGETTVTSRPAVYERVHGYVQAAPPAAVAWAQRAMAGRADSFGTLRAVEVPALVVVGEEDALSPPADAQTLVEALPDARLARIPAAGHLSALEAPEAFTAAVLDFLGALPTTL
jgi:pimeloyl-ACP methyl ester carboxylesterase